MFKWLSNKFRGKTKIRNSYQAAKNDRFTSDWSTNNFTSDEVLRSALVTVRQRSRDLAINNDYARSFFRKLKVNTVGPNGIKLQSKVRKKNGKLDNRANKIIETAWAQWIKKRNCSVCATMSIKDILNTAIETIARDGEIIIRKIKGYDNSFRFALQILEADHLDEKLYRDVPNGNKIRLGIEKNSWGKPVYYHLFQAHPGDRTSLTGYRYVSVPAAEIIHPFIKERPSQSRGVPWIHTAVIKLRMIGAFEEAAVINARVGASKMGFFIPNELYTGDAKDSDENIISEVEPAVLEQLPEGLDFKEFNPKYPDGDFAPFNKAMLRGVSSGIGCSYNLLTNDLEGVNFSSLRSGALEDRDAWKVLQQFTIENILDEVYPEWLEMAIITNQVPLNYADLQRLTAAKFQARTWDWVDPLKDMKAIELELNANITSPQRVCAKRGEDFEEVLEEIAEAKEMMKEKGIITENKPVSDNQEKEKDNLKDEILDSVLEELEIDNKGNGRH